MLFLLPFTSIVCFTPSVSEGKSIRGKVYARMELCQMPRVTVRTGDNVLRDSNSAPANANAIATNSSTSTTHATNTSAVNNQFFHVDLSDFPSTILQIEAECPPTKPDQLPLRATYSLNTTTIDWKGAHELLLFNDVSVLAFGYKTEGK